MKRTQAASPYRPLPVRRMMFECNRRLHEARGPRAFEMMIALVKRWPHVKSGIVYIGDSCIDAGREHCCGTCRRKGLTSCEHDHCCMARLMQRCGKTAHRAKHDLFRVGLVKLHGAGPGVRAGGKIIDGHDLPVGSATGYELDPALFAAPRPPKTGRPPSRYESPAQARVRSEGQRKLAETMRAIGARAGP